MTDMTAPPAGALEACEQQALDGLLSNLEHEAGDVEDAAPSIEDDEDAYWAYQSYHAIRSLQRALLAALRLRGAVRQARTELRLMACDLQLLRPNEPLSVVGRKHYAERINAIADDLARVLEEGE